MTDTAAARALMGEEVQEEEEVEKEAVVIMEEVTAEMVMVVVTAPTAATVEQLVRPCAPSVHAHLFAPSRGQILRTPSLHVRDRHGLGRWPYLSGLLAASGHVSVEAFECGPRRCLTLRRRSYPLPWSCDGQASEPFDRC